MRLPLILAIGIAISFSTAASARVDTIEFVQLETQARRTADIVAEGYACGFVSEIGDLRFAFLEYARTRGASESQIGLLDTYLTSSSDIRCDTPPNEFDTAKAALRVLIDKLQIMSLD